jgi:hypothetical protein
MFFTPHRSLVVRTLRFLSTEPQFLFMAASGTGMTAEVGGVLRPIRSIGLKKLPPTKLGMLARSPNSKPEGGG